ncbi:MAG: T9SS type A sorting domain-containing protein [Bacteroidia bacterium]
MKTKLILTMLLYTSMMQAQVNVDWFNYPGGVSLAMDSANNVYTANWDYNPAGDITLTKRNAAGTILWNVSYNNTDNTKHEVATWVEVDRAGNILVSGTIRSGYSNPVNAASLLMKYNSAGVLLWRVVYESSFDGSYTRKCLVDANNNIYVLGLGTGPIGQVTKVKKFDASGNALWNYFDTGGGAAVNFKFTPDNKIVLIKRGITGSINSYSKMDLNGNLIWNSAGITSISGGDAAGDGFGNTYIVNGAPSELKKLSPNGAVIWTQPNAFNGNKVEVGNDHQPVVGGYPTTSYGVIIKKYEVSGNLLWENLDADGPSLSLLALAPMRLDASNAAYIAGSTMSSMGVCKVNSNGTSVWAATTSSGYPVWFSFGTDNNVYVTGGTTARFVQAPPVLTCNAPINLSVTTITGASAKLNWGGIPNIIRYTIYYKKSTDVAWTKVNVAKSKTNWTLNNLVCNATYKWKIRTVCDTIGVTTLSVFSPVQTFTTGVCRLGDQAMESQHNILIYPNPVGDVTTISFDADEASDVSVLLYDAMGREVKNTILQNISEGRNEIQLDLSELKGGIYFCKISLDGSTQFTRIIKN